MISPATSGEIFTSVSGCTLPVAETVCTIVLRTAFSVVTGIGFSRFELMMETMIQRSSNPSAPKMIWRLRRERRFFAICGVIVGAGVVAVWCMKFVVRGARRARINLTLDLCKCKHVHNHRQLDAAAWLLDSIIFRFFRPATLLNSPDCPSCVLRDQRFGI